MRREAKAKKKDRLTGTKKWAIVEEDCKTSCCTGKVWAPCGNCRIELCRSCLARHKDCIKEEG